MLYTCCKYTQRSILYSHRLFPFPDPIPQVAGEERGGGWQDQAGAGWEDHCVWFAEGIKAELDVPGEWFYDDASTTLYVIPDSVADEDGRNTHDHQDDSQEDAGGVVAMLAAMNGRRLVVPVMESVVRVEGSQDAPVEGVVIRGLTLRDTLPTFKRRCVYI